ncbi:MAG: nitroreductase [Gammaproteobacteria bacterium]|nr:MAG: nitroreductase [Gammaproteobacteria bacterium]
MAVLEIMKKRRSRPKLAGAAPSRQTVNALLEAAISAPDHGRLRPWQFIEVRDDARLQLGEIFLNAEKQDDAELTDAREAKIRSMPMRAPLILIAVAKVVLEHKVPVIEQVVCTGAAVQNMLLVAQELGVGAMWRTGAMAYNPHVKTSLGLKPEDEIVGYLYLGEAQFEPKDREPLSVDDFLTVLPSIT